MRKFILLAPLLAAAAMPALAEKKTVVLEVPGMTCPVCPLTVRKALNQVGGVTRAEVDFEKKQAIVTFDDTKTSVDKLARATADAGYPATLKGVHHD
jgi:mercuric ion binding protein